MSGNIPPHEAVDQAAKSNKTNSEETEESGCGLLSATPPPPSVDLNSMSDEEAWKDAELFAEELQSQFGGDNCVKILLSYEKAGFAPNAKMEKSSIKSTFPNIPFTTERWRAWWANIEPMTEDEIHAEEEVKPKKLMEKYGL